MQEVTPNTWIADDRLLQDYFQQSDQSAFAEIVNRHKKLVWSVCARNLTSKADIEDAFQATFLILAQKRNNSRWQTSIAGWLYTVSNRTSRRIAKIRKTLPLTLEFDPLDSRQSTFEEVEKVHASRIVDQALSELSENQKTPLVLHFCYGWSVPKIARHLGISVSAAEGRIKRGRQKLKSCLIRKGFQSSVVVSTLWLPNLTSQAAAANLSMPTSATATEISSEGSDLIEKTLELAKNPSSLEPKLEMLIHSKETIMSSILNKMALALSCLFVLGAGMHLYGAAQMMDDDPAESVAIASSLQPESEQAAAKLVSPKTQDADSDSSIHEKHLRHLHHKKLMEEKDFTKGKESKSHKSHMEHIHEMIHAHFQAFSKMIGSHF